MPSRLLLTVVAAALACACPLLALPRQADDVTLVLKGPAMTLEGLAVWRQPPEREAELAAASTAQASEPDTVRVTVACIPGEYFVQTVSRVSPPFRLDASDCGHVREIPTHASAGVRGRVVLPPDSAPPGVSEQPAGPAVALPMRACAERGRGEDLGQYRVRATEDGHFAAVVPSGCLALGLRVATYAPIPRRQLILKPGEVQDLGTTEMRAGATIVVAARVNDSPAEGATVAAVPTEQFEEFLNAYFAKRPAPPGDAGTTDRNGSIAFVGLPPAVVHVAATGKNRLGLAGPFELTAGEETDVDDLLLRAGSTVSVTMVGDRGWMADQVLEVSAVPDAALRLPKDTRLTGGFLGDSGAAVTIPVPGRWFVELRSRGVLLDRRQVDVLPETAMSVQVSVERLRFRGRVFVGDAPAAGSLSLLRSDTDETIATADTDSDGRFTAALPEPGAYTAVFSRPQDGILNARAPADFTPGIETAVRLSPTRLSGQVIFADGRPAGDASITVERLAESPPEDAALPRTHAIVASDAAGGFVVRCLESGSYQVSAQLGARKSETRRVMVGENRAAPVKLVLADAEGVIVRIVNGRGEGMPVVHGWLLAPAMEPGAMPQAVSIETDADGTARTATSWNPGSMVHVLVIDTGHPVTAQRESIGDEGVVSLTVPATSGLLRLMLPGAGQGPTTRSDFNSTVLLNDRGAMVPLSLLTEMGLATEGAVEGSTTVVIPALAGGSWRIARFADTREMFQAFSGGPTPRVISTFTVSPGGSVVVDLR
jgi:hypothetical protein